MRISLLPNVGSGSQVPSLAKEGWLRHQKDAAKPPSPAQTGWLVPKKNVLESEQTTPSAPFIGTGILLDGASTPPLPRRGVYSAQAFSEIKRVYFTASV